MEELRASVRNFLLSRESDQDLVEDLTQETMFKVLSKAKGVENIEAWAIQVAKNGLADFHRKSTRPFSPPNVPEEYNALTDEILACQRLFIDRLDPESRYLIRAIDLGGKKQKELAEELGVPYPSLRSKIQRARQKLKAKFDETCEFEYDSTGAITCCWEKSCSR